MSKLDDEINDIFSNLDTNDMNKINLALTMLGKVVSGYYKSLLTDGVDEETARQLTVELQQIVFRQGK